MIEIYKGNRKDVIFEITDQDGVVVDLSSAKIEFVVKVEIGEGDVLIDKSVGEGIEIVDAVSGICKVKLLASDTVQSDNSLTPREYTYELRVGLPDGDGGFNYYTADIDIFKVENTVINS